MPELPEVETVRAGLALLLENKPVVASLWHGSKQLRRPYPKGLKKAFEGARIEAVRRRAKFLLLDAGGHTLINHLGMTGTWRMWDGRGDKHDHLKLLLDDGRTLVLRDPRRFGLVSMCKRGEEMRDPWLKGLGVEPLDAQAFCAEYLFPRAKKRSASIKSVLMDQKIVVGVGNIYASEALHRAGIAPGVAAERLSKPRLERLCAATREVLKEALAAGGTTLNDFRQAGGSTGYFQRELRVYDRAGQPCRACGAPIAWKVHAQRSSYWCRVCQK